MTPRAIAEQVWRAGVSAVDSRRLIRDALLASGGRESPEHPSRASVSHSQWTDVPCSPEGFRRVLVLGAGKAGAGMAAGVEDAWPDANVSGAVVVPADCVAELPRIALLAGRPAGVNEPRPEGVAATRTVLDLAREADDETLVLVLISGGGSALLVAPTDGVTLEAKQAITQLMASRGAPIEDLNAVRSPLSDVKAGGLARALDAAGAVHGLVISDVIGDPLPVIASGPCVASDSPPDAFVVLSTYEPNTSLWPAGVEDALKRERPPQPRTVPHTLIGTNATAVTAAETAAMKLGFDVRVLGHGKPGTVEATARDWADSLRSSHPGGRPLVLIDGGEPTVTLPAAPGRGGRNQQLAIEVLSRMTDESREWAFLSGGTDGEDGPTDAAGGVVGSFVASDGVHGHIKGFDAYPWLEATGCLLKTGPTHTNVMDLRVGVLA